MDPERAAQSVAQLRARQLLLVEAEHAHEAVVAVLYGEHRLLSAFQALQAGEKLLGRAAHKGMRHGRDHLRYPRVAGEPDQGLGVVHPARATAGDPSEWWD